MLGGDGVPVQYEQTVRVLGGGGGVPVQYEQTVRVLGGSDGVPVQYEQTVRAPALPAVDIRPKPPMLPRGTPRRPGDKAETQHSYQLNFEL